MLWRHAIVSHISKSGKALDWWRDDGQAHPNKQTAKFTTHHWLAPIKGQPFSLIYFLESFCIDYLSHNFLIQQVMPHAIPQTHSVFSGLTATLGARGFSCAVSGFGQVLKSDPHFPARVFGLRPTKRSSPSHTRKKPPVPRVPHRKISQHV